jgi:hypothetical protein
MRSPARCPSGAGEACAGCYGCEEFRPRPKPFDRNFILGSVLGLAYPSFLVWKHGFGGGYAVGAVALTGLWGVAVIINLAGTQRHKDPGGGGLR